MARKRNTGGNAQQRVAASTAKRIPSTRQEIVEDLRSVAAGGKPGGNRINEAYAAYRARKEQEQPERAMDEAVDAWVQWNQAQARTPQYRMAQDEAAEREASGYVSPENYAASIRANQRAAGRIRTSGVVMSDGRYHVGKRAQEELDRLAQSTARSELAMRAQEDETAMFRGSDYWLQRANELEQKRKAARSGYGGMMQGGTAFQETPEFTAQDRKDWDKAREYYYQVKNAERWGSMPEDLRQKALEAAGYVTDSVLAWQDGDEAALAGMTPDQRAQIQRDQRARRNQIAAILAGAGYEPEEVIEYASRVRNAERMQQEMAGLSKDVTGRGAEGVARGVYGTVQSYATNLLSPIGSVGLLAQKLFRGGAGAEQYRPVDYNTPSMYYSQATSTIRGAVGGQMGDVGRFFYDTVNSAVDSGVRMLVGQALGGGGIKPSPDMTEAAAEKLNRFVSGFISTQMSGEVFANSFVQAKESGSTDADALLDSVTSALIEGLTERYSVESILRNPNGLTWTALRNSFLAEGSEEMASDFLNTIYDELKNGDESELRTQYRELLASGATEDDAFSRVFGDYVKQVVLDGLAGGLSGIAMSGVAEYATNKRYEAAYADPADTQALLDEARAVNPDSKLLKRAEQRVAEGKGVTGYQARELMGHNEEKLAPLKQASAKYGKQSGAMQATYQEGQDVAQYDMSYRVAYEMGKAGTKLSAAQTSEATDYLTDAQKQAAWSAGRDARTRLSDVSEVANGRALLNGQIVQVQTISAQDGKLMAEVRQGESVQTVALDSLKVDAGTRTLAEGAKQYGSAAGTVFEQYKAGQDVAAYLRAADMAAAVGMASPSASSETVLKNLQAGQLGKALSGEQITAIYKAGQTAGRAQLRKTGMTRLGTGTVTFEQSAKGAKLNARQKASVQFIRDLAKVTGIDFTIYKSSADSTGRLQGANGAYRDGTVHVDLNAGAAYEGKLESASMLRTVSHELTHYMAEAASTEFSALQDFMVQRLSQWEGHSIQDLVEGKMATAEQAGHPITAQEALEEVVADGCEMMLRDSTAVRQLAEENRTLFEKVRDWMKKFFESLRKAFEGVEAVHPESIHMMENYAGELQKLWDEAFTAAVKNAKTANVDGVAEVERFSMRAPVEETRDLIAVHNLTEENLESSLNLGGLPSPSIAIVKAEQGHSKYGPISIVFDKSTIDPQADSRNKIYGSDAWTPTVPRVEYQVNSKRAGDLEYELNSLAKQTAGGIFSSASALRSLGIDDASNLNRQQLAEKLADNDTVRAAYLADQGKTLDPERMVKQFNRYGNEALQMLIDRVGVQELAGAVAELETGNRDAANGISDAVREIIRDTYEQNHRGFLDRKPELKQARLDRYMENNVSRVTVEDFVKDAWEMYQDGGQTKDEIDRMATREKLREAANTEDVQRWIDEKLDGVLGKAGIYNGKDRYTPSGNSRSFAQLHYDYTLENIVRAMNGLQQARGEGIWGASAESFVAVGTPDYRSIDEVRADKGRLREATEEEYDALKAKLDPMIEEIITGVRNSNKAHSDNQFEEIDIIGSLLLDAAKGTKTKAAIRSVFRKNGYTISDALISKAQSLYSEAAKMPTKYFEAKPQRAVSFDEAKAIIVPDNTSAALVQRLEKGGANVISYKAGDEQARLEALNAQEGVKFSDRDGNVKDASELTEADFYDLLARVENRELDDRTYIPMRATTPQFFIDVVTEHSGRKIVPQNLPMASQVEHVAQNMEEDDGSSYGAKRPHGLSVEDLVHIAKEMGHPSYIVKQQNGRYAEVVSFYNSRRKKVVVSVDFASNGNNYKYAEYMNGYDGGYYNIIVTQFEPDSLKNYLASNEVVYDKEKMNGRYQVGSGRIVTFTHDTPFIENSLAQNDPTVKRQERDTVSAEIATLQRDLRQMRAELKRLKAGDVSDLARVAQYDAKEALKAARQDTKAAREEGVLTGKMEQGRAMAKQMSRLEAQKNAQIARLEQRVAETQKRMNDRIAEQRQRLKDYRENRNETEAARRQRAQIEARCEELTRMLTQNNDKQHIPEPLKQPVKELLEVLTPSRFSQSMQERGTETQTDARLVRSLEKIRRVAADQAQGKLSDLGYLDLPPEFLDDIDDIFRFVSDGQTEPLYAMNSAQLKELNQVLTVLTTSIKQINRLITAGHFESVRDAAEATALDLNSMRERKLHFGLDSKAGKAEDVLRNFLSWKNTTPYYAFRRFGEGGQDMFRRLADGWDRLAFNSDRIIRFAEDTYTEKEVKAWEKEKHTVTLDSGEVITLSTANAMELYELSKREQAQGHLYGGGVRISGQGIRPVLLTVADVENIAGLLSERQKAVADKLQQYMEIQGSAWGNEVSMERFGYRYFTEPHYYPVISDSNELIARDTEAQENSMFRLLNLSATKGLREGANNAIVIGSIFDTFANHMSDMAKYNALALPILDTMKWFNYRDTVKNGAGQLLTQNVKQSIEAVYGSDALRYFTTFIKDLNGVSEGGRGEGFANRMISNYKVAAVAANLRVALLQPTAYVRAANVISPKYLTLALKNAPKALWNASGNVFRGSRNGLTGEMLEHSGIALWKSLGFYDTNIGRGVREQIKNAAGIKEKVVEKSMSLAELGDTSTWTVIWSACKLEQKAKGYTGQALLQQTAERFREVVYATQVVDSTMTRSHMMRSKSTFSKLSTAFMSEPTLSYNMLLDAAMGIQEVNRRGGNGWKAQGGKLLRAFTVFASTAAASALVESLFDAFRDDDDEDAITKFINALFGEKLLDGNLGQNLLPIDSLPYFKDAVSILQGYSNERMDTEFISKIVNTAKIWAETYKLETGELDKATKVTSYGSMTTWGKVYKTLDALSSTAGLPLAATTREVTSIWNATIGAISPRMKIKRYESKDQKLEWLYSFAQSGSKADYEKELAGLRKTFPGVKTGEEITESIQDGLRGKIKDHYLDGDLTEQEAQKLIERYTGRDAEEAEDDVNRWHYQRDTGDTDASASMAAAWYGIAEPAGIDREAFAEAWAFHNDVEADKDSSGKTVPGSKKQKVVDYIQGLGLSRDQEKALWDALKGNWKDTDTPWE